MEIEIAIALVPFIIVWLFFCALCIEQILHTKYTMVQLIHQLKKDCIAVVKKLFRKKVNRHIFDDYLSDEFRNVVLPYANKAFDIYSFVSKYGDTPCIYVQFVPKCGIHAEDLQEASNLLLLKFRRYLAVRGLNWATFSHFRRKTDYIEVIMYYAELEEDIKNFKKKIHLVIQEQAEPDFGMIQDNALNKELQDVD